MTGTAIAFLIALALIGLGCIYIGALDLLTGKKVGSIVGLASGCVILAFVLWACVA